MQNKSQPVIISQEVYDAMLAHAREGKPEEVCGVLRGRGLTALEAIRGKNIAEDKVNNYDVDPQTLLLQFKFEDAGEEMMGIYHSHPISVAWPSATDAWSAHYPDAVYFILSLEFDEAPVLRAFRMVTQFIEPSDAGIELHALRHALPFHEIRPQTEVYAYYQSHEEEVPSPLKAFVQGIEPPYYVELKEADAELRVIDIAEHPVQIVE